MAGIGRTIFGCSGPELCPDEFNFFRNARPWGFILFARNVDTPDQLCRLTRDLQDAVGRDVPILIDQEGGRVARMGAPYWREWLPPLDQVACLGEHAPRGMYLRYRIIADELRRVGINTNCVPCADLATNQTHPILRNRCYGDTVQLVTQIARSVAEGLMDGGVLPVLKHMPGHGRATLDSHTEPPLVDANADILRQTDFACFKGLNDLSLGMSAHIVFDGLGQTEPATTSAEMVNLIRDEIGFNGLLMTDDLSMQALSGSIAERTKAALAAGIDVILHCNGNLAEMRDVADEAGNLSTSAAARAEFALNQRKSSDSVDIAAYEAEFQALMHGQTDG